MPEGDTIHTLAGRLRPLLVDRTLRAVAADAPGAGHLRGRRVSAVTARGKHLLLQVDDAILHVHLGLHGSWHRYAPGEPWRERGRAALVLTTDDSVLPLFRAKVVEVFPARDLPLHPVLRALGPDLADPDVDLDAIVHRARALRFAEREIGAVLLDQRVGAGLGNVLRAETLFLERLDPWRSADTLDDAGLRAAWARGAALLRGNIGAVWRNTTGRDAPKLWVYGRRGHPCLVCGAAIAWRRLGPGGRTIEWCGRCQRQVGTS